MRRFTSRLGAVKPLGHQREVVARVQPPSLTDPPFPESVSEDDSSTFDLPIDELWPKPPFRSASAKLWAVLRHPVQLRQLHALSYFRAPVKWLLGRDLLTYFRRMAAYAAYADEMDHRDWMDTSPIDLDQACLLEGDAFWFDYLSDTGDGQLTMYNLAYLTLGDLWLHDRQVTVSPSATGFADAERLPRGRLLVVGGDTAYHVADQATLEERFRAPFNWAHADRRARGSSPGSSRRGVGDGRERGGKRYIAAIPGNHDYYDTLTGFNRLFRKHSKYLKKDDHKTHNAGRIADFERCQDASFFAMQLPHGWQLWGLDSQGGHLDFRQRRFFGARRHSPDLGHLIVLTPEPSTVFGRICKRSIEPFRKLQLPRPFIKADATPASDTIHLDIAGDVHHYVRHQNRHNYASVVAGGGAFLHPTHTRQQPRDIGDGGRVPGWPPAALCRYPSPRQAMQETTERLLCPWCIFQGGYVWLLGAAALLAIYFGITVPSSTQGISTWLMQHATDATARPEISELVRGLARHVQSAHRPTVPLEVAAQVGLDPIEWVTAALLLLWLSVVPVASAKIFERATKGRQVVRLGQYGPVGLLTLPVALMIGACWVQLGGMQPVVRFYPFVCSAMFLLYLAPLPVALWWTYHYLETLPKQAKQRAMAPSDEAPRWLALGFGLLSTAFAVLAYGATSLATLVANGVFTLACATTVLGPLMLARSAVKGLSSGEAAAVTSAGFAFGTLLTMTPILLTLFGSPWQIAASLVAVSVVALLTLRLHRCILEPESRDRWKSRAVLVAGWMLAAAAAFAPLAVDRRVHDVTLARLTLVALLGACFTCVWLGWYLAVASTFNAHNNEVGGAVRLDKYRHFIRFKLEANRLTGYVIALEQPSLDLATPAGEQDLRARLVDTIELHAAPSVSAPVPRHAPNAAHPR